MQLLAQHDNKRAQIEFLNAVRYNSKLLPAWQNLAKVEELNHEFGAMVPALRNVVELDPTDVTARIKLGRLMLLQGALDNALRLVNAAKETDNPDLMALRAAILFKLKDSDGAIREAKAALKIDPANAGALFVLAGDRFAHGDTKGALDILDSEPMAKKTDMGLELFKLQIFEKTKDLQSAQALLEKLIQQYPKQIAFKKELIRAYLFQHRNDDAEKVQRSIVAADPANTVNQLDLVRLLGATKGPAAAQQELTSLIKAGGDVFPYQIALAQLEFGQGQMAESTALLKGLIGDPKTSPGNVLTAQVNLAQMYLNKKKINEADGIVSNILQKDARNTAGLKLRAAIRMDRGQTEDAISDLRQALNDQPRAIDLMLMLAVAYERSGSIDLAEKEFANAMRVSNFNPEVSLNYVAFLRRRGSLARAEDVLTDLASRWPKNVAVLSALAQVKLARQDWVGAQKIAEEIKSIGNERPLGDDLLGAALAGQNQFDASISALQDAYNLAPSSQPMSALVRAYVSAHKTDQAVAFLQSVIKANPANAEAYVLLGSLQFANKSPELAKQSFMTAIAQQPKSNVGYRALSELYILQKNYDEAITVVRAGLKEQPDSFALELTLAGIFERTGHYDAAISEYQKMLDKNPGSIIVMNNLASLLADHRTDKASLDQAAALAASLQQSPVPQFKDTLGWVTYRQGDYKTALPLLEAAAAALPQDASVDYHLGMTYVAVGQPANAAKEFKLALEKAPEQGLADKIHTALAKIGTQ